MPIGAPGWPELAFATTSAAKALMVLTDFNVISDIMRDGCTMSFVITNLHQKKEMQRRGGGEEKREGKRRSKTKRNGRKQYTERNEVN